MSIKKKNNSFLAQGRIPELQSWSLEGLLTLYSSLGNFCLPLLEMGCW